MNAAVRGRVRAGGRLWRIVAAVAAVLAVLGGVAAVDPLPVRAATAARVPVHMLAGVNGAHVVRYYRTPVRQPVHPWKPVAAGWPTAGSWMAPVVPAGAAGPVLAAGSPMFTQPVAPAHGRYGGPARVRVMLAPRQASARLGIPGVVWQVSGLTSGTGGVRAGISYKSFSQVYGGGYGYRLQIAELPGCALTSPQLARCRIMRWLPSFNDSKAQTVSTVLPLPVAGTRGPVVLAAGSTTGGDGGPAGTYGATSLKPSGSWAEGGSSGSFTYRYPVTVPGASGALVPNVDLTYDSGSVDGQTAATQSQANWAGEGWSTSDSFIEQSFIPCKDNPEGKTLPSAEQTQDMCDDGNVITLSLNGTTTALVKDDATGTWRLQNDSGAVVTPSTADNGSRVTNLSSTGPQNITSWKIQERDGTTYWFGLNHLPGWGTGEAATNSVDTEPVYNPADSSGPCYSTASFSLSTSCQTAYRWHLDYVTDRHGNAMSYYYAQDTNYYAQDITPSGSGSLTGTGQYVRDSYLTKIDYGFRDGGAYGTIPDEITYKTGLRCFVASGSCPAITSLNSGQNPNAYYPDIPYDLNCGNDATCTTTGPSFWSMVRLTTIITWQYSVATGGFKEVDEYALDEWWPPGSAPTGQGAPQTLWLNGVTRKGMDTSGGPSVTSTPLPEVTFQGEWLANRVDTSSYPALYWYRIDQITSETGAQTQVTYDNPGPNGNHDSCTASSTPDPANNSKPCFPVYWTPNSSKVIDWFNKWAVTKVVTSDSTGGSLSPTTWYYYGTPAWHFDSNEIVQAKYRTYGQFRGYSTVTTKTGDGSTLTKQVTTYYQGMSHQTPTSPAVTLTDSQNGNHDDADQLAGLPLETRVYTGDNGTVDHESIYSYWISGVTADRTRTGMTDLTANVVAPAETWTQQALTDSGPASTTWRTSETDTTYDTTVLLSNKSVSPTLGLPLYTYTHTVPANAAYDRCTSTTYAKPSSIIPNLVGLIASKETDSVACSGFAEGSPASVPSGLNTLDAPASVSRPAQVVSATENFYDDPAFSTTFPQVTVPTTGNVTMTRKAADYTSGAFTWQTTARDLYDSYGRVNTAYDGNGNETDTAYTVDSSGLTTAVKITNPLGQSTSQTLDPTRGLVLTATDANAVVTTSQYDALGRPTSVWLDSGDPKADPANTTYTYYVNDPGHSNLSGVVTKTMGDGGGYVTTVTILDSLGRLRQTQTDTPQGGALITDTFYDSHGWAYKKNNRYWHSPTSGSTNAPAMALVADADNNIPNQDRYLYNGLGQVVQDQSWSDGSQKAVTTTIYNGDKTTVIPPAGGITKATLTDPLGRTTQVQEYTSAPTVNTPSDTFVGIWWLSGGTTMNTSYGYDGHGNQAIITDDHGNTWTTAYNLLGEATSRTTPDTGTTTMAYDGNGDLTQSVDARGNSRGTVSWTYDALNRKTGEYAAALGAQTPGPSGNQIAAWAYDNSNNAVAGMGYPVGHVTTETSYSDGNTYTIQSAGFNIYGESLGATYTIPSAAGAGLAGKWQFSQTYTTGSLAVGLPLNVNYPSGGGLAAESAQYQYISGPLDLPVGLTGNTAGYVQNITYDGYSNVYQQQIGQNTTAHPNNTATITNTYDPWSNRLTGTQLNRALTQPYPVDEQHYTYDAYGNITQQVSTRLGNTTAAETQCFKYDPLDRLTDAWTATDNCATTPTSSNEAMVGDPLSAASTYWTTWIYDNLDRLTTQTSHDSVTGGADTTTTDTYNGSNNGQVHTLTSSAWSGGSAGTSSYVYDDAGNMTTRATPATGTQTLTWNNASQLTQISSTTKGTTKYVYDANGNLLLQLDPASTILYLPGQQLTRASDGTVTGTRIIPLPGGGDAIWTDTSDYYFQVPDQHGTGTLYLDSTAQVPTWRQFTPYGAPRGQTATWIDNRGFLNKPNDPVTGLTDLGARQYDPLTTQFTSPDPILTPGNPQDLNPYAYAQDNPQTNSDPTGLYLVCYSQCGQGGNGPPPPPPASNGGGSSSGSGGGGGWCSWCGSAWHGLSTGANWTHQLAVNLTGGLINSAIGAADSSLYMLGDLYAQAANGIPTGMTPGGQFIFGNDYTNPIPRDLIHIGNPNSIAYKIGYYGAPFLLVPEAAAEEAANVPAVVFSRSRAPGIAQNFDNAVANGAPTQLTRVSAAVRDANRAAALRGVPPAPAGQSLDEYPFACSAEGGCGAFVSAVPVAEQSYQGGVLSRFFQDFSVGIGDLFNVEFRP